MHLLSRRRVGRNYIPVIPVLGKLRQENEEFRPTTYTTLYDCFFFFLNSGGTISSVSAGCHPSSVANFISRHSLPCTAIFCLNVICLLFCLGGMSSWRADALTPLLDNSKQCTLLFLRCKPSLHLFWFVVSFLLNFNPQYFCMNSVLYFLSLPIISLWNFWY